MPNCPTDRHVNISIVKGECTTFLIKMPETNKFQRRIFFEDSFQDFTVKGKRLKVGLAHKFGAYLTS